MDAEPLAGAEEDDDEELSVGADDELDELEELDELDELEELDEELLDDVAGELDELDVGPWPCRLPDEEADDGALDEEPVSLDDEEEEEDDEDAGAEDWSA